MSTMSESDITEVTGPGVRAMLNPEQRDQFEAEFKEILAYVTRSFDLAPLTALIRSWWIAAGGDVAAAERQRDIEGRWHNYTPSKTDIEIKGWVNHIPCTGPDVFEHLDQAWQVQFEDRWQEEVVAAAETFDTKALWLTIAGSWMSVMDRINPGCEERRQREYEEFLAQLAADHGARQGVSSSAD